MDVMYTDKNRTPMGVLQKYSIDLDIGNDNDFEIQMNLQRHCMDFGSIWFVNGTEYGGIVDAIKLDTYQSVVYYSGRSWRGILEKKILEPDAGQPYLVVSGDVNDILSALITRMALQDLFVAAAPADLQVESYQFYRYTDAYAGICKMLESIGAKLAVRYTDGRIELSAVAALDLSDKYEYSDDYGMKLIIDTNKGGVNHLICLGSGELTERQVIHLYADPEGNISHEQYYTGVDEIVEAYDYGNAEDAETLENDGIDHFKELINTESMSAQFSRLDVDIGDIVGGKNRMTGITLKESVRSQIVKIKNGAVSIEYKVGDEE